MKIFGTFKRDAIRVPRSTRPYYEEQGWIPRRIGMLSKKTIYDGFYRTLNGSFEGEIVVNGSTPSFYIINPPEQLKDHSHWVCFNYRGKGRYWIHFSRRPRDIDSGIMEVERMINEAFRQA